MAAVPSKCWCWVSLHTHTHLANDCIIRPSNHRHTLITRKFRRKPASAGHGSPNEIQVDPPTKVDTKPSCGRIKQHTCCMPLTPAAMNKESSNKQRKAEGLPFWYGGRGGKMVSRLAPAPTPTGAPRKLPPLALGRPVSPPGRKRPCQRDSRLYVRFTASYLTGSGSSLRAGSVVGEGSQLRSPGRRAAPRRARDSALYDPCHYLLDRGRSRSCVGPVMVLLWPRISSVSAVNSFASGGPLTRARARDLAAPLPCTSDAFNTRHEGVN
jgi:hypothetical protein